MRGAPALHAFAVAAASLGVLRAKGRAHVGAAWGVFPAGARLLFGARHAVLRG